MLSTYEDVKTFVGADAAADRGAPPMLGFVIGSGLSVLLWAMIGSIVWALVS